MRGMAAQQAPVMLKPRQYLRVVLATCFVMGLLVVPWMTTFVPNTTVAAVLNVFFTTSMNIVAQMGVNYFLRYGDNSLRRWLDYQPFWLNILLRISIIFITAAGFGITRFYIDHYWGIYSERPLLINALAGSQIFAFITIVLQIAIETIERSQYLAAENDRLKQEQLQARFEGLKQQLSPHFLFNSLSTLRGLIHEEPVAAEQFVEQMAEVYRYLLQHGGQTAVSLRNELAFLRSYCSLLQMRFGDGLQLGIDLPEAIQDRMLPPLTLQLLVENAVKHNVLTRRQPLRIAIEFKAPGTLLVRNTRQSRLTPEASNGIGLSNLNSRIRLLHHRVSSS